MSSVSDRAYFLQAIKTEPMTVKEIVDRFGCADGTARNWVRHPDVERIPGSWPTAYTSRDSLAPAGMPATKPKPSRTLEVPMPPVEQVDEYFRKVLAGDTKSFDFITDFQAVDSQKELTVLMSNLKTALIVCDHYMTLMKRDGMP